MAKIIGLIFPGEAPNAEPAAEKFVCPHCGKEYKSKDSLAKHIKDKHTEGEHPEAGQS